MSRSRRHYPIRRHGGDYLLLRRADRRSNRHRLHTYDEDTTLLTDRYYVSPCAEIDASDYSFDLDPRRRHNRCRRSGVPCDMDAYGFACYIFGHWGPYLRPAWKIWRK